MGFSRQEYRSGLPCPPPGDLSNPGIEPRSLAPQADSLPSEPRGSQEENLDTDTRGEGHVRRETETGGRQPQATEQQRRQQPGADLGPIPLRSLQGGAHLLTR